MITLYTFGPHFGLPDGSPFVTKTMLLLKFAGLPYQENRQGYGRAPKGKLPLAQKAAAWAIEKMCEEHLYLALLATRWLDDANFARGPAQFFKAVPMPLRPIVQSLVRRKVAETLKLQGFGRHTPSKMISRLQTSMRLPAFWERKLF